jgi:hypothetical protein
MRSPATNTKYTESSDCCAAAARDLAMMDQGNTLVGAGEELAGWGRDHCDRFVQSSPFASVW